MRQTRVVNVMEWNGSGIIDSAHLNYWKSNQKWFNQNVLCTFINY